MVQYRLTELTKSLPATVPFVGPETQERARGGPFDARIGANESVFGPSPGVVAAIAEAASSAWMYGDPENHVLCQAIAAQHGVEPGNIMVGEGIDALRGKLFRWTSIAPGRQRSDAILFTRRRWQLVSDCRDRLGRAIEDAEGGPELLVADLREALTRLEEITGESTPEDVLDRIFSRFCLGK